MLSQKTKTKTQDFGKVYELFKKQLVAILKIRSTGFKNISYSLK
jgi:hypothetical protein